MLSCGFFMWNKSVQWIIFQIVCLRSMIEIIGIHSLAQAKYAD